MKLLIVDDEELTRAGLISALDWDSLGITEIFQADDGVNGLKAAMEHRPDIVLCDVRMPRMDGIAMLERIEASLPGVAAIFMSGYSDKEYLKAAIQLKAVRYIEKPIDPLEIKAAVADAVEQCRQFARHKNAQSAHSGLAAEQLAFLLTIPYPSCRDAVESLCAEFHDDSLPDGMKYITTFIVKLEKFPEHASSLSSIFQNIQDFLKPFHLSAIYSEKRVLHIVYHIFGSLSPSRSTLLSVADFILAQFARCGDCYVSVGDTAKGISNAFSSYESAVILLQSSFFSEPGKALSLEDLKNFYPADMDLISAEAGNYKSFLAEKNQARVRETLDRLRSLCSHAANLMPNQIKAVYFELFASIYQCRRSQQLMPDISLENHENIMDIMDSCFSFQKLHRTLQEKTDSYFEELKNHTPENATVYLIREYIASHYTDPGLSVKSISEHVFLSVSYVCTYFKNETGTTLNQYITEFRMEKAKQLLSDPRYRITDVSAAVGYSDGNYFGKSFKKYIGLSPSEYRDKVLQ